MDGIFKSWAVTKGPSLDPSDRLSAVEVEDHPLDYGDFEGSIPQGEYGGGTVMLWDRGFWTPEDGGDPVEDNARPGSTVGGDVVAFFVCRSSILERAWLCGRSKSEHQANSEQCVPHHSSRIVTAWAGERRGAVMFSHCSFKVSYIAATKPGVTLTYAIFRPEGVTVTA